MSNKTKCPPGRGSQSSGVSECPASACPGTLDLWIKMQSYPVDLHEAGGCEVKGSHLYLAQIQLINLFSFNTKTTLSFLQRNLRPREEGPAQIKVKPGLS